MNIFQDMVYTAINLPFTPSMSVGWVTGRYLTSEGCCIIYYQLEKGHSLACNAFVHVFHSSPMNEQQ